MKYYLVFLPTIHLTIINFSLHTQQDSTVRLALAAVAAVAAAVAAVIAVAAVAAVIASK